jgi:hypothetical protein
MASKEVIKKNQEAAVSPFVDLPHAGSNGDPRSDGSQPRRRRPDAPPTSSASRCPAGGGTAWTLQTLDGEEMVKELAGIIVAWRDTRAYWSVPLEQSEGNMPPDCYSLDARTGTGKPGGDCHKCPLAQFGSDPKGGPGLQARAAAVLRAGGEPAARDRQPSREFGQAGAAVLHALASKAVPCYSLITKIGLEKTKNAQGIVYSRATFTSGGRLWRRNRPRGSRNTPRCSSRS